MTPDPQLEAWLETATRKLAPDSTAQVRAEITEHVRSARDAERAAIDALGDPKRANREYRRVLLTAYEARFAVNVEARKANPTNRISWGWFALSVFFLLWAILSPSQRWQLWIWGPSVGLDIVRYFLPPTNPVLKRVSVAVGIGVLAWITWQWYSHLHVQGLVGLLALLALLGSTWLLSRRVRRKLAGRPASVVVPNSATPASLLTPGESNFLRGLQQKPKCPGWTLYLMISLCAVEFAGFLLLSILPWHLGKSPDLMRHGSIVLAAATSLLLSVLLPLRVTALQTPERGRRYRRVKWTLMAIAALAPPVSLWVFGLHSSPIDDGLESFCYFVLLIMGYSEYMRVSIRRKLPAEEWPRQLFV